jgi:hypothetical protein
LTSSGFLEVRDFDSFTRKVEVIIIDAALEIRNQIYAYAITPTTVRLRLLPESEKDSVATPSNYHDVKWRISRRTCIGLSQTCWTVRSEMIQLHHQRTASVILANDINKYITDFLPEKAWACGRIYLDFASLGSCSLELLPLLQLNIIAPKLEIYEYPSTPAWTQLSKLLLLRRVEVWRHFIQNSVTSISYRIGPAETLKIVVKPSARAEWMPWNPPIDTDGRSKKVRSAATLWRIKAGLGGFSMPFVEVAEEEG